VEGLEVYADYCFRVEALRNAQSFVSETACARTLDLVISAPENVVAEATGISTIELTWDEVEHAMSYNVYNDTVFVANVTSTSYTVEGLEVYTDYCFRVEALRNAQAFVSETACARTLDLVIAAPTNVLATATGISTIELTWEAVEHAMSYNVYQGEEMIANVTETTYTIEGLDADTEYCFSVTSVRNEQESEMVDACATTEPDGIVETEFSFSIYPNPVDNKLTIETESYIEEVTIYSLAGVMMYKEIDFNNHTIDVSELSCGVYFVKVVTENGESVKRFIKK
ncbi:MAG: T9SS type A sorting domain-containing protein, partial [Bacteroidales bacterium]|nr:T9SS type A sorting domain-containing protein [Bacteroidales bacterium]